MKQKFLHLTNVRSNLTFRMLIVALLISTSAFAQLSVPFSGLDLRDDAYDFLHQNVSQDAKRTNTAIEYTTAGDWHEYQINSASGGEFYIKATVASPRSGAQLRIDYYNLTDGETISNAVVGTAVDVNTGDWNSPTIEVSETATLDAGDNYIVRVSIIGAECNIFEVAVISTATSTDASLSDLQLDAVSITGFDASTYEYTAIYTSATTSVNLTATVNDANASVAGTGSVTISEGVTIAEVTVTAEAGNTQVYTVRFVVDKTVPATILMASDAYSSVGIDEFEDSGLGAIRDGNNYVEYLISATTTGTYNLLLTHGTGTDPTTINVDTYAPGTTFTLNNAKDYSISGANVTSYTDKTIVHTLPFSLTANTPTLLRVTYDASGWNGNSWGMEIQAATGSTDATLSDLTVGGVTLDGFDSGTLEYTIFLPVGTTTATLGATANDANAQGISGTGAVALSEGRTTVSVTCTAEVGNTKEYKVNIITPIAVTDSKALAMLDDIVTVPEYRAPSVTNSTINWWNGSEYIEYYIYSTTTQNMLVSVNAANADAGDSQLNVSTYTQGDSWTIDANDTRVISGGATDWGSEYATDVDFPISLTANTPVILRLQCVSNANGNTLANVYGLSFATDNRSADATLSDLKIDGATVAGFDPATYSYDVVLGITSSTTIAATANDAQAQGVAGTGNVVLNEGNNEATVTVTAENGATKEYTLNILTPIKHVNGKELQMSTDLYSNNGTTATDTYINHFTTGEYVEYYIYAEFSGDILVEVNCANGNADGVEAKLNVNTYPYGGSWSYDPGFSKDIPGGQEGDWGTATDVYFFAPVVANQPTVLRIYGINVSPNVANIYGISLNSSVVTSAEKTEVSAVKVFGGAGNVNVLCNDDFVGGEVEVYTLSGALVAKNKITTTVNEFTLNKKGMFIIRAISPSNAVQISKCIVK